MLIYSARQGLRATFISPKWFLSCYSIDHPLIRQLLSNPKEILTLSAWQTNIDTSANSVDSDETACNELSGLDLHCQPVHF